MSWYWDRKTRDLRFTTEPGESIFASMRRAQMEISGEISMLQTESDFIGKAMADIAGGIGRCHSGQDGECNWPVCPQVRDGEPAKSRRHCPLDTRLDDER